MLLVLRNNYGKIIEHVPQGRKTKFEHNKNFPLGENLIAESVIFINVVFKVNSLS